MYNVKPYLVEALDSVVQQTYENLEIIIIDDGSTDASGEMCDIFAAKDERITVIHQENRGLSNARNAGLDMMHGEYVVFFDPDDAFHHEYVKNLISAAIYEKTDIVVCRYTSQRTETRMRYSGKERKEPTFQADTYDRRDALRALVDGRLGVVVWNKIYHTSLWANLRFPDGLVYEDVAVMFRIFDRCKSVCAIDKPLYIRRVRHGSITGTLTQKTCSDWQLSYSAYESFIEGHTPATFSYDQLRRVRYVRIITMIEFYIRFLEREENAEELFRNQLRRQIIRMGDEEGIQNLRFRARVAYQLLCNNPRLLQAKYQVYRPAKQLAYRCTGKPVMKFFSRKK